MRKMNNQPTYQKLCVFVFFALDRKDTTTAEGVRSHPCALLQVAMFVNRPKENILQRGSQYLRDEHEATVQVKIALKTIQPVRNYKGKYQSCNNFLKWKTPFCRFTV